MMNFRCSNCGYERDEESPFIPGNHEESLRGDSHEFDPEIICALCASDYPSMVGDASPDLQDAAQRALDSWLEAILPAKAEGRE